MAFFYNGIGDHVLAMPALRVLSQAFSDRLTLVCSAVAPLFLFDELRARRLLPLHFWQANGVKEFDAARAASELKDCDLFVSLVPWWSDSMKSLLTRLHGTLSIGLSAEYRVRVSRGKLEHRADATFHVVNAALQYARLSEFASPLQLPEQYCAEAQKLRNDLFKSKRILVVHGETSQEKTWPLERLLKVIERFLASHPDFAVCLVGKKSVPVEFGAIQDRLVQCHSLPLATSFALVAQADLFLGVDSCMLHVADICRVPGVALFGPTRAENWGFRFGAGIAIQGNGSMESIQTCEVNRALDEIVQDRGRSEIWDVGRGEPNGVKKTALVAPVVKTGVDIV